MKLLDVLLDNARLDAERARAAKAEAGISYRALEEVIGPPLDALARWLHWAALPEEGEHWICEHGNDHVVARVERRHDGTALVNMVHFAYTRAGCHCAWTQWHTSAFLLAWTVAQ